MGGLAGMGRSVRVVGVNPQKAEAAADDFALLFERVVVAPDVDGCRIVLNAGGYRIGHRASSFLKVKVRPRCD